MKVKLGPRWLATLLVALLTASTVHADRVTLKKGKAVDGKSVIEGKVYARTVTTVYVKTADGKRHKIPVRNVASVEKTEGDDGDDDDDVSSPASSLLLPAIPAPEAAEKAVLAKLGTAGRVKHSAHYSIVYTGPRRLLGSATTMLERVYQRFFSYFEGRGLQVRQPSHKLVAVVFPDRQSYVAYGQTLSDGLAQTSGFYFAGDNTLCFFVNVGTEDHKQILAAIDAQKKHLSEMKRWLKTIPSAGRITVTYGDGRTRVVTKSALRKEIEDGQDRLKSAIRKANAMQRNADIAVVSHEATHQLTFNSGLLRRWAPPPVWLSEGLAMFFESTRGGKWRGVGKINPDRLCDYRAAKKAGTLLPIADLLAKPAFLGQTPETMMVTYAEAWALTHFLMHKRQEQFATYLEILGRRRTRRPQPPRQELADFRQAFGSDLAGLETEYRQYVDQLRE